MMAKLGEVCEVNPKTEKYEDDFKVSFVPMPKVSETGKIDTSEIRSYRDVKKGFTGFKDGDVLFAKITPCMENGKGAVAHSLMNGVGFGSTEFHVLRPKVDLTTSKWLYYLTSWHEFRVLAEKNMTGSAGQKRVPKKFLEDYELDVPSLEEQRLVAGVLDKVTALMDARRTQLTHLDTLIKAHFVEMFGDEQFKKVKAADICDFITKGTTPHATEIFEEPAENRIPFLKVYNLSFTGELLFEDKPQYIVKSVHEGKLARSKVYPNDVLMNIVGPPLGKFAIIPKNYPELNINQAMAIFRAKEQVVPRFLLAALMQPEVLRPFLDQAVGIRQQNLSLEQCRNLEIPLPPLALQNDFADFVAKVDGVKASVQASLDELDILKKSLMQMYFG